MPKVTRSKKVHVGLDLDGVVFDFVGNFTNYVRSIGKETGDTLKWNFYHEWGMSDSDFERIYANGIREKKILYSGKPIEECASNLRRLRNSGCVFHVVTDRSVPGVVEQSHKSTRRWLKRNGIPYNTVTFTGNKTSVLPLDAFVEDNAKNAKALLDAGCKNVALMSRPWNETFEDERWTRVKNWSEFETWLNGVVNR